MLPRGLRCQTDLGGRAAAPVGMQELLPSGQAVLNLEGRVPSAQPVPAHPEGAPSPASLVRPLCCPMPRLLPGPGGGAGPSLSSSWAGRWNLGWREAPLGTEPAGWGLLSRLLARTPSCCLQAPDTHLDGMLGLGPPGGPHDLGFREWPMFLKLHPLC